MGQTVYTVASVLLLLFLLMYIFAILGFCLFGSADKGDHDNWGNLAAAFFTLFSLATVLCLGTVVRAGALGRDSLGGVSVWTCGASHGVQVLSWAQGSWGLFPITSQHPAQGSIALGL